jgi:hypothetical protein
MTSPEVAESIISFESKASPTPKEDAATSQISSSAIFGMYGFELVNNHIIYFVCFIALNTFSPHPNANSGIEASIPLADFLSLLLRIQRNTDMLFPA